MTDDTQPDLRLILRNTEKAASDIRTVRDATERLTSGWGYRLDAIEARLTGLEQRFASREAAAVADLFGRLNAIVTEMPMTKWQLDAVQKRFAELADMLMAISERRPEFPNRCDNDEPMWVE
jgi:uncharacterized coiled-coil protein SlyX